ncbi:MAG TPA: hypothetical protein VF801_02835 [Rhodocyclaceae bacterium]
MRKTYFLLPLAVLLLAGCVNVHVHFPSAPPQSPAADQPSPGDPQKKP